MIQVNLLPDVKQQFIKARRLQRVVVTAAVVVAAASLSVFILLLIDVKLIQTHQINSLSNEIRKQSSALKETPDINRILTVQAQLKSLPDLHAQKPAARRLGKYLAQVTPSPATISKLKINFEANTIEIEGAADKLETVNKFVDTLKFTTYKKDANSPEAAAFKGVVLSDFKRDDKTTTYKIDANFEPAIFDFANKELVLIVTSKITTRSETERPLFQQAKPLPKPAPGANPKDSGR